MRCSQLFTKTSRETPRDEESRNATLLIRGGFIAKEMAGVYVFLPLGLRVLNKVIAIIRKEINALGGQEVHLSALQNPAVWQATNRWDDKAVDVWFKTKLLNGNELGLGFTHEEPLTKLMSQYITSYKDLPKFVYQFQTKFRNEVRAKAGLLRTREFVMKDLYSFTADQDGLDQFYERAKQAYVSIFERIGIGQETFVTFASGGGFSKYSPELQTVCPSGADPIYVDYKKRIAVNKEVLTDEVLSELNLDRKQLEEVKAIEVGNIFKLGTRFSQALGLLYRDATGAQQPVVMGSYGIGPARVMATVAELTSDQNGLCWPVAIAPARVYLVSLGGQQETKIADTVYSKLQAAGIEVLYDDRNDVSAGQKFTDADLIGTPFRAVVSAKTSSKVELSRRGQKNPELVSVSALLKKLHDVE